MVSKQEEYGKLIFEIEVMQAKINALRQDMIKELNSKTKVEEKEIKKE